MSVQQVSLLSAGALCVLCYTVERGSQTCDHHCFIKDEGFKAALVEIMNIDCFFFFLLWVISFLTSDCGLIFAEHTELSQGFYSCTCFER